MAKNSTFKLYTIEGINYDAIIAIYRQLCETGEWDIDKSSVSVYGGELKRVLIRKPRKPLNDDVKILNKAKYLIHTIAYRQITNRDGSDGAYIQYAVLQKVIGQDVYELLKALVELGYVEKIGPYIVGKHSMRYKVNGIIISSQCCNYTIKKYIEKTTEIIKDAILERFNSPEFIKEYGDSFAKTYKKS